MAFVGMKSISSSEELRSEINTFRLPESLYFLRWTHEVSGMCKALPANFPSPEGQMFNVELELRWKQRNRSDDFDVLLLGRGNLPQGYLSLELEVDSEWEVEDRHAFFNTLDDKRFPRGFQFFDDKARALDRNSIEHIPIRQRYFRDRQTAIVHFVALTLEVST